MKARAEPKDRPPRLRTALAASAAWHLMLLAVPAALWHMAAPGPKAEEPLGPAGVDFLVVSLADAPEVSARPAERVTPTPAPETPVPPEGPPMAEAMAESAAGPMESGSFGEGVGDAEGALGPAGPGIAGNEVAGASARYRPPRLLAGALPLTPQESESLPSPLEIPVRLRIDRDGRVTAVEPADPALAPGLRAALERSARAMRFVPARLDEAPVEAWFAMTFIYRR